MPYPKSPFESDFDWKILVKLGNDDDESTVNEFQKDAVFEIMEWLCSTPKITTYRFNKFKIDAGDARDCIEKHVKEILGNEITIRISQHPIIQDAIIVHHNLPTKDLKKHPKEIIVDTVCASAILRGAHIFAPGVLGMMSGTYPGTFVSIYADVVKKCKKGFMKVYEGPKLFIANGIVKMAREDLFCDDRGPKVGIAVQVIETISNCPPIGDNFLPSGTIILQNLPSIICTHVLNPQPLDVILDMCASPGNKTTHIAALMENKGKLVAIDKTPNKVAQLKQRCFDFGAKVEIFQTDSSKIIENQLFPSQYFDKILLDAPCSALGKRPQLVNKTTCKVLRSYVPLQRKLFANAVHLLKEGGVLVYSTCTITLSENEGIVSWALKNFPLLLVPATPMLAQDSALKGSDLKGEDLKKIQRFGPRQQIDSVGFFIAKFIKKK